MALSLTTGSSSYNALLENLRKSFSASYEFLVSYTWSYAIDDWAAVVSTSDAPENNFSPNAERATSSFDQRHRLVLSGVYNTGQLSGRMLGTGLLKGVFSGFTLAPSSNSSSGSQFWRGYELQLRSHSRPDKRNDSWFGNDQMRNNTGGLEIPRIAEPSIEPCYADASATSEIASPAFNGNLSRNVGIASRRPG